jgi:glutaredoxin
MPSVSSSVRPRRLTVVLAQWCPHCVPLSVRKGRQLAKRLGVPFRTLDIDRRAQEKVADRFVREHGDASPDYLIPQVFLEWSDGRIQHLLTGFSEQVARTARAWDDLLGSAWLRSIPTEGRR